MENNKTYTIHISAEADPRDIYGKYGFVKNGEMCGNEIVAVYELFDEDCDD